MIPSDLNQLASRHYWQYWFAGALGLVGFVYGLKLYSKRPRRNGEDESEKSDVIEKEKSDIDEDLHSRQLAVYGRETMRRLFQSNVLISGLQGLGAEIAKNLVLAGVKSVTLHDEGEVEMWDLSANFLLSEDDIGKNRAESSVQKLQELNNSVKVSSLSTPLSKEILSNFQAVVFTDISTEKAIEYDDYCHTHNPPIPFIKCEIRGLFGGVFCDFGPEYTVLDIDGEEPHTGIIASISNENPALVTCVDDDRLEFHDGDLVIFSEIQGMTELNDGKPRRINSTRPYSFFLEEDTTNYKPYKNGGIVTEIKQPKTLNFKTLKSSLKSPGEFLISDYSKLDRSPLVHMAFIALDEFRVKFGRFPCRDDLGMFSEIVRRINEESECKVENIDEGVLVIFLNGVKAVLNPMAAVFGGIVGQEVVKACSSKFHPIFQFFYFDSIESLPPNLNPPKNPNLLSNRYGPQISVFGTELQTKLENSKIFLVGSGALGCEFLKNLALMGVSCGPHGTLTLTDDDIIERSNLSRQFLFRESHVGHSKSSVAASAAKTLNPDFKIQALQNRVSPETENSFPDSFWEDLDVVINALDNVNARLYVDSKCVYFQKPLLESGTLGPKCNTQVIFPHLTENYGASRDPPEKSAPMCTLHSFPHNISHCLAWARSEFEGLFEKMPSEVNLFLGDVRGYASEMRSAGDATAREKLESVLEALQLERSQTFNDCVAWARHKFEEYFSNRIKQLTFTFPEDSLTSSGALFWSAPKRFPRPLTFDPTDPTHINLIMAGSILRAETFGVPVPNWARNPKKLSEMVRTIPVRNFMPKEGVKIETDEKATSSSSAFDDDAAVIDDLITKLERVVKSLPSGFRLKPIQFEKDDDTNYHMEFISGLANMRARNYSIPEVDKLKAKLIAGRIIPAIATSTSLATGLICLELYKTLIPNPNLSSFKNTFVNLAVPLFSIAEPVPPKKVVHKDMSWTVWDRWVLNGDKTLKEVLEWVRSEKGLTVYSVSCGSSLVYNGMFKSHEARLERRIAELAREIGKVEDLGFRKCLDLVVACEDDEGIDVDVPLISVYLR